MAMDVSDGGDSGNLSWRGGLLGAVGQPARRKLAEGGGTRLAAGKAGPRAAGGVEFKEGESLGGSCQPANLDVVSRVLWGFNHYVWSHFVATERDPIAVGTQLFSDWDGLGPSVCGH